ncbi:helix-turn-helix transcriptional regulator [Rhodocytophaga aerolata]|uniref:Helix-turn-helix transcriptional regulator n=1 Tax=Rhodocytophaga aerolata TaxID=455078 RepID=A0ABT8RIS9_9BACT|nr:helix-turn-helix transcriptional regulator [Rhodocytophaga aerolata]MDO1451078.1 helix-turn-helix transcriptional regulator [Rhodocytophaga aerolata]
MNDHNSSRSYNLIIEAIGKRIIALRKLKGYSQAELAERCGKKPQSLERVENGKINPSIKFLLAIAFGLGISLKELLDVQMA